MAKRAISTAVAVAALLWLLMPELTAARQKYQSCKNGKCPPKIVEQVDPVAENVIWQVSHDPSLMNIQYLKYLIGRPENERTQRSLSKSYYWYDADYQLAYELHQTERAPGQVVESTMIVYLDG